MTRRRVILNVTLGALLALTGWVANASAEMVLKVLIVNPSETEVKEFEIKNPLPPEVKPEHVIDADGLKVDYDSQAGTYFVIGSVTLKPKEAITKRIVLEDVWVIPPDRLSALRRETKDILTKLEATPYLDRGRLLTQAIEQRVAEVEESQEQPFLHPVQHINRYRDDSQKLQLVDADLVSLRQLMVMAALNPAGKEPPLIPAATPAGASPLAASVSEKGNLSILATWRLIFIILGLLGFVSLSFFLVWQRQLKMQLAKQAAREEHAEPDELLTNGNGKHTHADPPVTSSMEPRLSPKGPLSS